MPRSPPVISAAGVAGLTAEEVDAELDRLEAGVPVRPVSVTIPSRDRDEAYVFGDSHGDWRSVGAVIERFKAAGPSAVLVGLGDYIDRAPVDSPGGSADNALALLGLAAAYPDRVFLLAGNHELAVRLGAQPHTLPREMARLWGEEPRRYRRLMALLERGPLMARTENGAYLAHAGFPRGKDGDLAHATFDRSDESLLLELTWPEADASGVRRGAALPWGATDLDRFLGRNRLALMLRGHDPDLTGRPLYGDRCLTLHTCRLYGRYGGVIYARLPLRRPVGSVRDLSIEELPAELERDGSE